MCQQSAARQTCAVRRLHTLRAYLQQYFGSIHNLFEHWFNETMCAKPSHAKLLSGMRDALTWSQCSPIHNAHQGTHHHVQVGHLAVPPPHQVVRKIIAGLQGKGCHCLCPGIMGQPHLGLVVAEQCEAAHTGTGCNMRQCQCVIQLNGLQSDGLYQMICVSTGHGMDELMC